jgi:hypothetical protein
MDKQYVCPCGLTCCDCLFYKPELYATARQLRDLIQSSQLDTLLRLVVAHQGWNGIARHLGQDSSVFEKQFQPFAKLPDFMQVLEGIINLQCPATCREASGCSIGGTTHACDALTCVQAKGVEGCWQCQEYETCDKLSFLRRNYGETINGNLSTIRDEGIEAVTSRGNQYYAWQRR